MRSVAEISRLPMKIYIMGGLRVRSEIPLFELPVCANPLEAQWDVSIRRAPIPAEIASVDVMFQDAGYSERHNGREVLLDFSAVGRFLLRAGREIYVDRAPS